MPAIEIICRTRGCYNRTFTSGAYLSDQLQRAGLSIPLNIAEGAGEYSIDEKARFYRMAKRSATECAGILDVCQRLQLVNEERYTKGRELLIRVALLICEVALHDLAGRIAPLAIPHPPATSEPIVRVAEVA